jgi:ABC-type dipeptide/oligopeptide/nickel transport system permease component
VVQGVNLLLASVIVLMNLVTDLTYALIDPRIRYR